MSSTPTPTSTKTGVKKVSPAPRPALQPASQQKRARLFPSPNTPQTLPDYMNILRELDKDLPKTSEYGSILILGLMEEVGEIARAYLAEHGRKPTNKAAQRDETYKQELGDLLISIMRLAIIKNINLDHRIQYTIKKIQRRKSAPKE